MGFIRMIIELILFYYVLKLLARLFLPIVAKKVVEKVNNDFEKQFQNQQNQSNYKQKDGVILDDSKVEKKPKTNDKVGEYVDFEEIE